MKAEADTQDAEYALTDCVAKIDCVAQMDCVEYNDWVEVVAELGTNEIESAVYAVIAVLTAPTTFEAVTKLVV